MLHRFGKIVGVVATVAKVLRVSARQQTSTSSPQRREFASRIEYRRVRFSVTGRRRGSHRYDLTGCIACARCARNCPAGCIHVGKERVPGRRGLQITTFTIDYAKCLGCGLCSRLCPTGCLMMDSSHGLSWYSRGRGIVDFSRLPVEVAWGRSTLGPTVTPRPRAFTRPAQGGPDQHGRRNGC
jgi:NADH-quinone oxidoreductase subunit I